MGLARKPRYSRNAAISPGVRRPDSTSCAPRAMAVMMAAFITSALKAPRVTDIFDAAVP